MKNFSNYNNNSNVSILNRNVHLERKEFNDNENENGNGNGNEKVKQEKISFSLNRNIPSPDNEIYKCLKTNRIENGNFKENINRYVDNEEIKQRKLTANKNKNIAEFADTVKEFKSQVKTVMKECRIKGLQKIEMQATNIVHSLKDQLMNYPFNFRKYQIRHFQSNL